ncbi:MAG: hypothetical protein VKJ64_15535 [Leptolyngbyaceae bacterium]|nr:hypothetical protein [Leptolyngbyaceae bacterium]
MMMRWRSRVPSPETRTAAIRLGQGYLTHDRYHIIRHHYTIENRNLHPIYLLIEQRIQSDYSLFDTPAVLEQTAEFYRWGMTVPDRVTPRFTVKERSLNSRQERLTDWSDHTLSSYLKDRWIDQVLFDQLQVILDRHQEMTRQQRERDRLHHQREQCLKEQGQTAKKLENLATTGEEGQLRQRFVAKIGQLEDESDRLLQQIQALEIQQQRLQTQIDQALADLSAPAPLG